MGGRLKGKVASLMEAGNEILSRSMVVVICLQSMIGGGCGVGHGLWRNVYIFSVLFWSAFERNNLFGFYTSSGWYRSQNISTLWSFSEVYCINNHVTDNLCHWIVLQWSLLLHLAFYLMCIPFFYCAPLFWRFWEYTGLNFTSIILKKKNQFHRMQNSRKMDVFVKCKEACSRKNLLYVFYSVEKMAISTSLNWSSTISSVGF